MNRIKIELGDITEFKGDAIVNAANQQLSDGEGVDGAIHSAAGPQLLEECQKLDGCEVGEAKITNGFNLRAKHVIHTVGPIWEGGENEEEEMLESCYLNSLWLAEEYQIRTMAFPAISTGAYGFPLDLATQIAIGTTKTFLETNELPEQVTFICFDQDSLVAYEAIFEDENEDPEDPNIWNIRDEAFRLVTGKPMSIWAASYTGNIDRIKKHLDAGLNVNELADGQSPLHYAAEGGMSESVKLLIDKNSDVNAKNKDGNSPLHLLAQKGKKIIMKSGKQVASEALKLLLTAGADVNAKNYQGNTPLHLAAGKDRKTVNQTITQLLVENDADINAKNERGDTSLHLAAQIGIYKIVDLLVAKGADVGLKNNDGLTAQDVALDKATADFISKEGAKRKPSQSQGDIFIALRKGGIDVVKQYISSGGVVNKTEPSTGSSLLHHACMNDRKEIAELLIDNGADVNAKNKKNSDTSLHYAARKSYRMTELLLEKKADVNAKNDQRKTPRDVACDGGIDGLLRKHGGKKGEELETAGK